MRSWQSTLLIGVAVAAASCAPRQDSAAEQGAQDLRTFDVRDEPPPVASMTESAARAPGVSVTAAPGVAFDYRYAFRLPTPRIGTVQEAHATMCEKLGIEKCRITGMRYQLRGSKNIAAMLALRLDPSVARQFGKDATKIVNDAQGMLVDQEISGIDVGSRIDSATRTKARLQADIDRLEVELKAMTVKDPRRGDVSAQIEDLRRQIASLSSGQSQDREALAGTPMVFNYGSGSVIPGFEDSSPIADALGQAGRGFENVVAGTIVILGTLLPLALLAWLAFLLWRRFGPRLSKGGYRNGEPGDSTSA